MTIDVNKKYMLTGGQIEDLASRLALTGGEVADKAEKAQTGSTAPTTSTPGEIGQLYIQSDGTVYILKSIVEESGQPDEYTWEEVGGGVTYTAGDGIDITNDVISATNTGEARVLTTADYNYPADNPTSVALWLLDPGIYMPQDGNVSVKAAGSVDKTGAGFIYLVGPANSSGSKLIWCFMGRECSMYDVFSNGSYMSAKNISSIDVVNSLTSTSGTTPLSAAQGKALKDFIGDLTNLTTTDKTNLVAAINEAAASGGGSGVIELTSADYNYPTNNPNSVALWKLDEGLYSWDTSIRSKIKISTIRNANDTTSDGALVMRPSTADSREIYLFGDGDTVSTSFGRNTLHFYKVTTSTGVTTNTDNIFFVTGKDLVSSTGNSPTSAMSQYGATKMIYYDTNDKTMIQIGAGANASVSGVRGVAIGQKATANGASSIALGSGATTPVNVKGVMSIGSNATGHTTNGYNNSQYRLLTGLYDPQSDHDAATKGYVDNSLLGKQDALTAGSGISIADESGSLVISTTVAEPDEFTSNEWNALWS